MATEQGEGDDSNNPGFQDVSGKLLRLASVHPVVDARVSQSHR